MKSLITLYPLKPGKPITCPVDKLVMDITKCYKIDVGYGERMHAANGNKGGYKMTEKIATYYIGEFAQEATVKHTNMFGTISAAKKETEDTFYIKLTDGRFHEVLSTSQVINPKSIEGLKLVDLFDESCYLG